MARKPLIAGNWKMNLDHREAIHTVQKLAFLLNESDFESVDVTVLPPFTDLRSVQTLVDGDKLEITYGAQDCSPHASGAFTGDISAGMLARLGCSMVIVGHSERRALHGETDDLVRDKARAALAHDLIPIVCVGEGLSTREAGDAVDFVLAQVDGSLAGLDPEQVSRLVIAYEPVWAIGTGRTATGADAQQVCGSIRAHVAQAWGQAAADSVRLLYGGSVKASNITEIMAQPDVDGVLVGGASLDPDEFVGIIRYRLHPAA